MSSLAEYRDLARRLNEGVRELEAAAAPLEVPAAGDLEWCRTLRGKLLPQLGADATLVVAVVGGTNIGKSVVFNHICGEAVSRSAPTAAGTKHPTVAVPRPQAGVERLANLFPGFELREWSDESDPVEAAEEDLLFWKPSDTVPENLVVLDTPDVDSTMKVNWDRADKVRRSADLLVAVLTQQKYNDAAVREFFSKAADEGQIVAVVMNQVMLPEDAAYWSEWVGTFCGETGITPELVYVSPLDRAAAGRLELPFHQQPWPPEGEFREDPHDLLKDLSSLHFDRVKVQALHGALEQVAEGVPDYLQLLRQKADDLRRTEEDALGHLDRAKWPALPNALMKAEVREWWAAQRTGWVKGVHNTYGAISDGLSSAWGGLRSLAGSPRPDLWAEYRAAEWSGGVRPMLDQTFAMLERLEDTASPSVREAVAERLAGVDRAAFQRELKALHEASDIRGDLDRVVNGQMARFRDENVSAHEMLKKLDTLGAAARPLITAGLFAVGAGPLVEVGLAGSALNVAAETTGGAVLTTVGDKLIGEGAGAALSKLQEWYNNLHARFVEARAAWLEGVLKERLLGDLPDRLRGAVEIGGHAAFARVAESAEDLRTKLAAG